MPTVKHVVIAAAGLGSRLGHGKPKCLVEVDGVSILEHQLSLLSDVEDVRVVVGFDEKTVISELRRIRPDVLVVRNPAFRSTTTLHSYAFGAKHLKGDCLFMDGDLLLEPDSFSRFLRSCEAGVPQLGITKAKTSDAVFVEMDGNNVVDFRRQVPTEFEWSNIAWLPVSYFDEIGDTAVYEHLRSRLPILAREVVSYEVDTEHDLIQAVENARKFGLMGSLASDRKEASQRGNRYEDERRSV